MNAGSLPSQQRPKHAASVSSHTLQPITLNHLRPLPPDESRETIRTQAAQVTGWRILDVSDDIYESLEIGNPALSDCTLNSSPTFGNDASLPDFDAKPALDEGDISLSKSPSLSLPKQSDSGSSNSTTASEASSPDTQTTLLRSSSTSLVGQSHGCSHPSAVISTPSSTNFSTPHKRRPSPLPLAPRKKRRLIPTQRAIEIANQKFESFDGMEGYLNQDEDLSEDRKPSAKSEYGFYNPYPDGFPLTDAENWLLPDPHPGSCLYQDSDHEDEGYWSQIIGSASSIEGETAEAKEERRMKLLARFHTGNTAALKPAQAVDQGSSTELNEEEQLLKQAREVMLKEQEAGAERSRQLREKALRRRGLLESNDSSTTSEQDRTFSEKDVEESSGSDLVSNSDDHMQVDDLLDIAQDYATKDSKPTQPMVQDSLRYVMSTDSRRSQTNEHFSRLQPQKSEYNSLNPASRAAAEHFRTQSRHLSHHNKDYGGGTRYQPSGNRHDSHVTSQDMDLQDREQRLRDTKNMSLMGPANVVRSVSNPALGNQFTRDDFGHRIPRRDFPERRIDRVTSESNRHATNRKSRVDYDDDSHGHAKPSSRTPSGLDLLAAKAEAQRGVDSAASRERNSHPATHPNIDSEEQLYSFDSNGGIDGSQNLTIRRPSGLEMLVAHQSVANLNSVHTESTDRPLSGLEVLAARQSTSDGRPVGTESHEEEQTTSQPLSSFARGPNRGLTLPKNFDRLSEEDKEIIVQHEIAKERKRDLDALGSVFWAFAELRCYSQRLTDDRTRQQETTELFHIGEFIALVIDQGRPGKTRRKRIQDIRDNIRRRVDKTAEYSQALSDVYICRKMSQTFKQRHIEFVDKELSKVQKEIERLGASRSATKDKRKTPARRPYRNRDVQQPAPIKKQVRFEDKEDGEPVSRKPATKKTPRRSGTATENRRQAQYDRQDRTIEQLKAQLELFKTADEDELPQIQSRVTEIEAELERFKQHEDSESEEEDGAEFVFGAGHSVASRSSHKSDAEQEMDEINRLENARQKEDGTHALQRLAIEDKPQSSQRLDTGLLEKMQMKKRQGYDPELLRQMQLKKAQQLEAAIDPEIIDGATGVESDNDSDATAQNSSEDDSDNERDRQVFIYTVYGAFRGIPIYKEGDQYEFQKTYNLERAREEVATLIRNVPQQIPPNSDIDFTRRSFNADEEDGMLEQRVDYGQNKEVQVRVWTERKEGDLDKKRFQQAKRRGAVKQSATWAVHWEKTITPLVDEAEQVKKPLDPELEGYEDLLDDLFEETPQEKSKIRDPITTSIDPLEIPQFTAPAFANRRAMELYLEWYNQFLPGWQDEGYRQLEAESLEQKLESLGNWGLFNEENSFDKVQTDEHGNERKAEERYRVWVRRIAVKGPGN